MLDTTTVIITNIEQAKEMYGAGSQVAVIAEAVLQPTPTMTWEERKAQRTAQAFEKAKKIDATNYTGWVSWPGQGDEADGYFDSTESLRKHCANNALDLPAWVWACTPEPLEFNADWIVEQALQEHFEGARVSIAESEVGALQEFLDKWAAKQNIVSWHEDTTRAVMLAP
jgi:hypothetical protein